MSASGKEGQKPRHGGVIYYPGVSLDPVELNPRGFSKYIEEGAWFCSHKACPDVHFVLPDGDRTTIWDDNTGELHYRTEKPCSECQLPMVFVGTYTEIIYVSQVFKDRVSGVLRTL